MWVLVIILEYFNVFNFMTFEELQIGDYFRLPSISPECVYRKASSSHCSQNTLLQPIRPGTKVIRLTEAEVTKYFAAKEEYFKSLTLRNYT
jgi:hypothetical protein